MPQPQFRQGHLLLIACYLKFAKTNIFDNHVTTLVDAIEVYLKENHADRVVFNLADQTDKKIYFSNQALRGNFSTAYKYNNFRTLEGSYKYRKLLDIYCGHGEGKNLDLQQLDVTAQQAITILEAIIPGIELNAKDDIPEEDEIFIKDEKFAELEFEETGIQINCISHSLYWASEYIPLKYKEILEKKNSYRYLLTESSGETFKGIIDTLFEEEPELEKYIEIRCLHHSTLSDGIKVGNVLFPIANDLVIYQRKDNGRYGYHMAIIGAYQEEQKIRPGYSIKIDPKRGKELLHWFNIVWKRLDSQKKVKSDTSNAGQPS